VVEQRAHRFRGAPKRLTHSRWVRMAAPSVSPEEKPGPRRLDSEEEGDPAEPSPPSTFSGAGAAAQVDVVKLESGDSGEGA
jgi:hypothetical protein